MFAILRATALATLSGFACATAPASNAGPGKGYEQVPRGAYSIVAEVRAKPGKEAGLRAATLPLVPLVRAEPKNLVYFLQEDRESPGHFVFYEVFTDQQGFEAHNDTPYVKEWFAKLPELAEGNVKVTKMAILARER
jgi:quinol monooxygenase YgiN